VFLHKEEIPEMEYEEFMQSLNLKPLQEKSVELEHLGVKFDLLSE